MKKLLLVILSTLLFSNLFAQTINISTGLNGTSSSSEAIGSNDGSWRYGTAINGTTIPKVMGFYAGYWQATPVTATGAQWIGTSGNYMAQKPGLYYYERTFTVNPGVGVMTLNFAIAIDDDLKSVELIDPSGTPTDLTSQFIRSTSPTPYYLSKVIKSTVKCPESGKWKVRVYVNFVDTAAGFLLSGTAVMEGQCCKIPDEKCKPDFKIKLTMNERCGITIDAVPVVTKGAQHYWGIVENKGDCKHIPLGQIISGNTFGLSVSPTGVVTPIGMGTGLSGGSSGFGYFYAGLWGPTSGKCYKITHYVKCCQKWYRKTVCFCPTLCNNEKEIEFEMVPINELPKEIMSQLTKEANSEN